MNLPACIPAPDDEAYFATAGRLALHIHLRILVERAIVRKAMQDLVANGYWLRVHDGEDWACKPTQDLAVLMAAIMATDKDWVYVYHNEGRAKAQHSFGWIQCVYGNDGWDVIANNTVNLEPLLAGATALSEQLQEQAA